MKLPIRFADQIVGAFIILAIGILIFVIFMLGSNQRWFSRDYYFKSYFNSAAGINSNMSVQYKGFTIGNVKSIRLSEDDMVEVVFTIFDTYMDRVRIGSLVEVQVSPIGLGGGFIFHPGLGAEFLSEWDIIPSVNSDEGKKIIAEGLVRRSENDDSISNIMNQAGTLLDTLNLALRDSDSSITLGRIMGEVEGTIAGLRKVADQLPGDIGGVMGDIGGVMNEVGGIINELENVFNTLVRQIEPILDDVRGLTQRVADPGGTVMTILDSEGDIYTGLASSLESISGTLRSLEKTAEFIPPQLPQIGAVIADLHVALQTAEDVLVSLTNNPLLRRGIPERRETPAGGTRPRNDIDF